MNDATIAGKLVHYAARKSEMNVIRLGKVVRSAKLRRAGLVHRVCPVYGPNIRPINDPGPRWVRHRGIVAVEC